MPKYIKLGQTPPQKTKQSDNPISHKRSVRTKNQKCNLVMCIPHWLMLTRGTNSPIFGNDVHIFCDWDFLLISVFPRNSQVASSWDMNSCFLFLTTTFCFYLSLLNLPTFYPLPPLTPIFSTPQPPSPRPRSLSTLTILSKTWGRWVMSWETKWLGFVYILWFFHFLPLDSSLFCTTIFSGNILLNWSLFGPRIEDSQMIGMPTCQKPTFP